MSLNKYRRKAGRRARKWSAKQQDGLCYYCEMPMITALILKEHIKAVPNPIDRTLCPWDQCTSEHVKRLADTGPDESENIVAACKYCNDTRGGMPADQWKLYVLAHIENIRAIKRSYWIARCVKVMSRYQDRPAEEGEKQVRMLYRSFMPYPWTRQLWLILQ